MKKLVFQLGFASLCLFGSMACNKGAENNNTEQTDQDDQNSLGLSAAMNVSLKVGDISLKSANFEMKSKESASSNPEISEAARSSFSGFYDGQTLKIIQESCKKADGSELALLAYYFEDDQVFYRHKAIYNPEDGVTSIEETVYMDKGQIVGRTKRKLLASMSLEERLGADPVETPFSDAELVAFKKDIESIKGRFEQAK